MDKEWQVNVSVKKIVCFLFVLLICFLVSWYMFSREDIHDNRDSGERITEQLTDIGEQQHKITGELREVGQGNAESIRTNKLVGESIGNARQTNKDTYTIVRENGIAISRLKQILRDVQETERD